MKKFRIFLSVLFFGMGVIAIVVVLTALSPGAPTGNVVAGCVEQYVPPSQCPEGRTLVSYTADGCKVVTCAESTLCPIIHPEDVCSSQPTFTTDTEGCLRVLCDRDRTWNERLYGSA